MKGLVSAPAGDSFSVFCEEYAYEDTGEAAGEADFPFASSASEELPCPNRDVGLVLSLLITSEVVGPPNTNEESGDTGEWVKDDAFGVVGSDEGAALGDISLGPPIWQGVVTEGVDCEASDGDAEAA